MSSEKSPVHEHDYDSAPGVRIAMKAAKSGDREVARTLARRLSYIIAGDSDFSPVELDQLIGIAEAGWNEILSSKNCSSDDMYQYAMDILWDDDGAVIAENAADGAGWMLRAAELGNPDAQLEVGRFYLEGVGLPKDQDLAAEWFAKAALDELNAEHAHYFLGEIKKNSRSPFTKKAAVAKPVKKKPAKAPARKPVAKKTAAKKTAVKKPAAAKKVAAKKPVAKPVAKKAVKAVAKKKPVAKKAGPVVKKAAKPAVKKKTAAKKVARKR